MLVFIIMNGIAQITENEADGTTKHLTKIYQGACVGEAALLDSDKRRNANIIAVGKLKCMCLTLNGFHNLSSTKFRDILIKKNEEKQKIRIQRRNSMHKKPKLIHRASSRRRSNNKEHSGSSLRTTNKKSDSKTKN